jgi:hypothetical protein
LGQKPFREAENSNNGVMNPELFNLYFGKLLNTKLLANVKAEKYAAVSKKNIFLRTFG